MTHEWLICILSHTKNIPHRVYCVGFKQIFLNNPNQLQVRQKLISYFSWVTKTFEVKVLSANDAPDIFVFGFCLQVLGGPREQGLWNWSNNSPVMWDSFTMNVVNTKVKSILNRLDHTGSFSIIQGIMELCAFRGLLPSLCVYAWVCVHGSFGYLEA